MAIHSNKGQILIELAITLVLYAVLISSLVSYVQHHENRIKENTRLVQPSPSFNPFAKKSPRGSHVSEY